MYMIYMLMMMSYVVFIFKFVFFFLRVSRTLESFTHIMFFFYLIIVNQISVDGGLNNVIGSNVMISRYW